MQRSASCSFLCGPLTSQQAVNGLREALQKGVEKHAEVLYYRKDGECYLVTTYVQYLRKLALFTKLSKSCDLSYGNCQMSGLCKKSCLSMKMM